MPGRNRINGLYLVNKDVATGTFYFKFTLVFCVRSYSSMRITRKNIQKRTKLMRRSWKGSFRCRYIMWSVRSRLRRLFSMELRRWVLAGRIFLLRWQRGPSLWSKFLELSIWPLQGIHFWISKWRKLLLAKRISLPAIDRCKMFIG